MTTEPRPTKGRAPHRRNEAARIAVLHAADDLLVEKGFGGVTIEGIASRAGVAKQTIYRWWSSKTEVLLDTLVEDAERELSIADTDVAVEAEIRRYLHALARFVTDNPAGRVLLALIGQAQHDPEMARTFHERYLDPQRERERALLRRGIASGDLPDLDPDATLDALVGPILFRALTSTDIPETFVDGLVTAVLDRAAAVSP